MKAYGIEEYGNASCINSYILDIPQPKTNQVQIKVAAAAINPYDIALRRGDFRTRTINFPYILGCDLVGQIIKLGDGVTTFNVGDWVINHRPKGAYSQVVTASTPKVMPLPKSLTLAQAASLPTPGIAAYHAWFNFANISNDMTIAIIGIAGAVGSLLAQIAQEQNINIIGVGNSRHRSAQSSTQLTNFIAYNQLPKDTAWKHQADVVFNATNGGNDHDLSDELLKENGQLILFNSWQGAKLKMNPKIIEVGYKKELTDIEAFAYWYNFLEDRTCNLEIEKKIPATLADIRQAHHDMELNKSGKIVIDFKKSTDQSID